ncbi:MAG: hypothetical protein QG609_538 [Patescibacteria group bacterium]|nr:hypothetical protein [Patescibacteria group bacterium]
MDDFLLVIAPPLKSLLAVAGVYFLYLIPLLLVIIAWKVWILYRQTLFISKLEWLLLEIKIPRIIDKPPQAMEVLLAIFNQGKEGTFIERWWNGFVPVWFSLEMASFGGDVHFYIRTQKGFKNAIEAHIYSQFPEIEIKQVEDYTLRVPYEKASGSWDLWGVNFALTKDDHFPIKTYVDYGLDKAPKEEVKVDPITPMIEVLGNILPGEEIWSQILIRATTKRFIKKGTWFTKVDWKEAAKAEIVKLYHKDVKPQEGKFNIGDYTQTEGEKNSALAIQRSMEKAAFDCGWRFVYIAKKEQFNSGAISGIIGSTKQFSSQHLNGFKPGERVGFDYPWQDMTGKRTIKQKWQFFDAFRRRSYFYPPYKKPPFILTTEELATIYRFPGAVAGTPSLGRIESKRSEPPANLPL